jgi:hypothetical protein
MYVYRTLSAAVVLSAALTAPVHAASWRWINVPCKFADKAAEPRPPIFFDELLGDDLPKPAYPTIDHYFRAVSYGQLNLAGSQTTPWVTIGRHSEYVHSVEPDGTVNYLREDIYRDCAQTASILAYMPDFDGINVMLNFAVQPIGWSGGHRRLVLNGVSRSWAITIVSDPYYYSAHWVVAHEMLHGIHHDGHDLGHSGTQYNNGLGGYGNVWDALSSPATSPHPTFDQVTVHPIAHQKYLAGWLNGRVFTTPDTDGRWAVALDRLSLAAPRNFLMAKVTFGLTDQFFTLETRMPKGAQDYDSALGAPAAVIVHHVKMDRDEKALIVDLDGNGVVSDDGARLLPGERLTFSTDLSVEVAAQYADGFDVYITRLPPRPTRPVAGDVDQHSIEVFWTDRAVSELEYGLQWRRACPATNQGCGNTITSVGPLPANSNMFAHTGLTPNHAHQYRVRACLGVNANCGSWSEWSASILTKPWPGEDPNCPPGSVPPHCVVE